MSQNTDTKAAIHTVTKQLYAHSDAELPHTL